MFISGVSPFFGGSLIIRSGSGAGRALPSATAAAEPTQTRDQLLLLRDRIETARDSLRLLDGLLGSATSTRSYIPASTASSAALETGPARPATLRAVQEVNSTPTSYSPFGPEWSFSTAAATIGGVYDGAAGSGTMRIEVTRGGTLGKNRVSLEIYNPDGSVLKSFNIHPYIPAGTPIALGNGLNITLEEGALVAGDVLEVELFHDVGGRVDPNAAFDGVRNERPNFDPGRSVVAGSFTVNGVAIDVGASDTLLQVLDRITNSAAGVNAYFDADSETVRLEQKTAGLAHGIELGPDSSGFLAAVKLDGAVFEPGLDDEISRPLAEVARFAAVGAGELLVNGVAVAIDPAADTLLDVLAAVNSAGAGASAALDRESGLVTITSNSGGRPLELDDGGTGLLAALGISGGRYQPEKTGAAGGMAGAAASRAADAAADLAAALNDIFDDELTGTPGSFLTDLRADIRQAADRSFNVGRDRFRTGFGVNFDFREGTGTVMRFDGRDRSQLVAALRRDSRPVRDLFSGGGGSRGLAERMDSVLRGAERELGRMLTSPGTLLDVTA